jgi:hypothetical protein
MKYTVKVSIKPKEKQLGYNTLHIPLKKFAERVFDKYGEVEVQVEKND